VKRTYCGQGEASRFDCSWCEGLGPASEISLRRTCCERGVGRCLQKKRPRKAAALERKGPYGTVTTYRRRYRHRRRRHSRRGDGTAYVVCGRVSVFVPGGYLQKGIWVRAEGGCARDHREGGRHGACALNGLGDGVRGTKGGGVLEWGRGGWGVNELVVVARTETLRRRDDERVSGCSLLLAPFRPMSNGSLAPLRTTRRGVEGERKRG
jgi:hypothetical protein